MAVYRIILRWTTEKGWEASRGKKRMWETRTHFIVADLITRGDKTQWFTNHERFTNMQEALHYMRLGKR